MGAYYTSMPYTLTANGATRAAARDSIPAPQGHDLPYIFIGVFHSLKPLLSIEYYFQFDWKTGLTIMRYRGVYREGCAEGGSRLDRVPG